MNAPTDSARRLPVLLLGTLLLQVIATANTLVIPVLTPTIPGATTVGIGWYMTVLYLGAMAAAAGSGSLIARLGPMRASQVALVLQLAGLLLALPGDAGWRLAGAMLCGLGYGPVTPSSSHILARHTPPGHVGLVFSIKQTGVPVGGLLTGLLLIPIASLAGWRLAIGFMLVLGVLGIVLCTALQWRLGADAVAPTTAERRAPWHHGLRLIWREPALRGAALLSLGFSTVQLSLGGYLVLYLNQEVGLSLVQAGLVFGLAQAGGIVGRLGWGRLADVLGSTRGVLLALGSLMALSCIAIGLATAAWPLLGLIVVALLFGATAIGWNGVFLAEVARLAPAGTVAATTGAVLFFTYIGVVIGPALFAQVSGALGGLGAAFVVLAAVPALALLALRRIERP